MAIEDFADRKCCVIFYKIGPWAVTSYYLRYLTVAFFLIAALYSFLKVRTLSWSLSGGKWSYLGGIALLALCGILLGVKILSGTCCPDNPVKLAFPLGKGSYSILQGGSNGMTNPFHAMSEDGKYAIDIIEIGKLGNRATNFLPESLAQYHIFGNAVYSPCSGKVISAVDGLPDNMPTKVDREHTAGNHIVIKCKNIKVLLAHLKKGSVKIETGKSVKEGQRIGEVGNSGNSDEPHLHIQANRLDDQPVAILFGDRFVSTNDLYVVK
ncbi:M23 family metallopeptidase [Thiomicrorhabdus sp.]|uniref:M23 family metallopeptidase n=1 Tax=Thiomicrorhabdus sp. TaxID=2039724 RepID=UPI003569A856